MAKTKKEDQKELDVQVENQNVFMKILLSTSLDAQTHLKEYDFKIFDKGNDVYNIIGEKEGVDTINFEHTWKQ